MVRDRRSLASPADLRGIACVGGDHVDAGRNDSPAGPRCETNQPAPRQEFTHDRESERPGAEDDVHYVSRSISNS
jgi:hypothetical protein